MAGIVFVVCLTVSVLAGSASCQVSLSSTLPAETPAHLGDTIRFTCITVGSGVLAWRSGEYIGQNGEQLSLSLLGSTSSLDSFAVATLDNSYMENGQRVLESTLVVIVQGTFQNASVTCYSLGTDESNTTTFHLADNPSVFCGSRDVCPGDVRTFVCETRDSNTLGWESDEYVGAGGFRLSFLALVSQPGDRIESVINPNVSAKLIVNNVTNGVRVLKSELTVVVSPDILDDIHHLVTCINIGLNTKNNYTLHMAQDGSCDSAVSSESETTTGSSNSGEIDTSSKNRGVSSSNSILLIGGILGGVLLLLVQLLVLVGMFVIVKKAKPRCRIRDKHV